MASRVVRSRPVVTARVQRRRDGRGDTMSYVLTVAFVLSLWLVGLAVIFFVLGNTAIVGAIVLTMLLVLLALGALFVASGNSSRR